MGERVNLIRRARSDYEWLLRNPPEIGVQTVSDLLALLDELERAEAALRDLVQRAFSRYHAREHDDVVLIEQEILTALARREARDG